MRDSGDEPQKTRDMRPLRKVVGLRSVIAKGETDRETEATEGSVAIGAPAGNLTDPVDGFLRTARHLTTETSLHSSFGARPRFSRSDARRVPIGNSLCERPKLNPGVSQSVAGIVTPDTILRWYRRLIAKKYDGRAGRCFRNQLLVSCR